MAIYIPDEHYVGFQQRQEGGAYDPTSGTWKGAESVLLGFATPVSNDKAFQKRKDTVDHWAKGYQNKDKTISAKTLKNELMEGFEIARSVRRHGWNGGNVVWRIVDPRGFELEVSSANFASIVSCSTIVNGVIQGRCVWGRDGASNVLLPEHSEPYLEFVELTRVKNQANSQSVSIKDVKPGYVIKLESGDEVEYLGKFYCHSKRYTRSSTYHGDAVDGVVYDGLAERFMCKTKTNDITAASRLKIAQIVDNSKTTILADNCDFINANIRKTPYVHVSVKRPTDQYKIELTPVDVSVVLHEMFRDKPGSGSVYVGKRGNESVAPSSRSWGTHTLVRASVDEFGYSKVQSYYHARSYNEPLSWRSMTNAEKIEYMRHQMSTYDWFKITVRFADGGTYEPEEYYQC